MSRRLLARLYSYRLREHVQRHGFMSSLKLAITAKTVHVFQGSLPARMAARRDKYWSFLVRRYKYVGRFRRDGGGVNMQIL